MKLGVATICPHIYHEGQWWSYEPYVLEMNVWNELFDQLIVVAPHDQGPPPQFWAPYQNSAKISVIPYRRDKGRGLDQAPSSPWEFPRMLLALAQAARQSDAFHVRAPGSIALCGALLLPLLQRRLIAKFAGQWTGYPGEARTVRWQRALLQSRWWRGPVTVYGEWPEQPPHVIPFFTSVLNAEQTARARVAATAKQNDSWQQRNVRLLFVGRLSVAKNVSALLKALAQLKADGIAVALDIVGDGPERDALERMTDEWELRDRVRFAGGVDFARVLDFYERADVLALVSETEGWPKAIAEAMAFGLVCIGSERGLVPWMLSEGRGLTIPPGDADALATCLRQIVADPARYQAMAQRAAAWSRNYSLEGLRDALRQLLNRCWQTNL